ncbi:AfsR/SARP family transcriptional regulator [Streptacidiphilus carbonis]|uniref:AfsR/SARP family transcriptional regulator n=1 Tax=Streptacidiphilus carbonis TaxID=105422 RepID=UPI0005A9461A|nr:BTAD domain-containing putative transcriptional regulator [Streptacidiphilus carbonis]
MRIQLLGPFQVTGPAGDPVELVGARTRVLLTALALEAGRAVSAAALTGVLWPGASPANPANALQALVSRLRSTLGRDLVAAAPQGYRLALDPGQVDALRFQQLLRGGPSAERLSAALDLWRGPALADVPGFEDTAARLESLRDSAREDLFEARIAAGRGAEVCAELAALSAAAPLRDRPRALLMRALHQAGRSAEALTVYEQGRALLADELGADPSPLLRQAHQAVLTAGQPDPTPPSSGRNPQPTVSAAPAPAPAPDPSHAAAAPPAAPRLPAQLTSFLGRDDDLAAVAEALRNTRLVTLTGPGGAGKTRLSLEAAARHHAPVRLVELAPVAHPGDLPSTLLTALQLRESLGAQRPGPHAPHPLGEAVDRIVDSLGARELLIVLDNCEHLVDAAADLSARLLAGCPGLRILATSREPLGITGEQQYPVLPLAFPTAPQHTGPQYTGPQRTGPLHTGPLHTGPQPEPVLTVEQALAFPAVRLFQERAAAVRAGFRLTAADLPPVIAVCQALDGQPLALELAAARISSLSPTQISDRLAGRFQLLTGGSRTALPRHRTLRAVVDWSWDLLEKPERSLLARMSVFSGGAELETVEQVCSSAELTADQVLDGLASLVDKSLVVHTSSGRYRLLETIKAYAAEKLAQEDGAVAATRTAHAAHFTELAETGEPRLYGPGQVDWLARFLAEHENLVSALRWSVEQGDAETAVRLVAAMGWYLWRRGERGENLPLVHAALALPADGVPLLPRTVAHGITALYSLDTNWDPEPALALMRQAMALRTELDDPFAHPLLPLLDIMDAMFSQRDWRIIGLTEALFEAPDPWVRATAHLFMGYALQNEGRPEEADEHLRNATERFEAVGDLWGQSFASAGRAELAQWRGDGAEAVRLWELAISMEEEMGVSADSADYRARLLSARRVGQPLDDRTLAAMESEAEAAMRDSSWQVVLTTRMALADAYRRLGRAERARDTMAQVVDAVGARPHAVPQMTTILRTALAQIELADGSLDLAEEQLRTAVAATVGFYDGPIMALAVQGWAELALRRGDAARAAELMGAAHTLRGMPDHSSPDVARITREASAQLGEEAFARAYERGRATPREDMFASFGVAVEGSTSAPQPGA